MKKITALILAVIFCLCLAACDNMPKSGQVPQETKGPEEMQQQNDKIEPGGTDGYETILSQYRTAICEGWSGQQLVDAGLNYMIRDVESGAVGYAVEDLDGDGIPELAIGTRSGDEFYGKLIFAFYTQDENGTAVQLFSSTERNRFYYAGGFRFANIGSSAWDDSFVTTMKLERKEMIDMTFTTDPADYVQMELTPFLQHTGTEIIAAVEANQDVSDLLGEA